MTTATGPNASTWCGSGRAASVQRSSSGDRNAPRRSSPPATSTCSGSPNTSVPAPSSAVTAERTSSRCSRLTSAPTSARSSAGLPTTAEASRADTASMTASARAEGTRARRIAVHFCPALTVISVTSWSTYRPNSGVPGAASGPSTDALSESASALNRADRAVTAGCPRSRAAVAADPVNHTESWPPSSSSRPRALPQASWSAPSGSTPASMIRRTMSSVR